MEVSDADRRARGRGSPARAAARVAMRRRSRRHERVRLQVDEAVAASSPRCTAERGRSCCGRCQSARRLAGRAAVGAATLALLASMCCFFLACTLPLASHSSRALVLRRFDSSLAALWTTCRYTAMRRTTRATQSTRASLLAEASSTSARDWTSACMRSSASPRSWAMSTEHSPRLRSRLTPEAFRGCRSRTRRADAEPRAVQCSMHVGETRREITGNPA